MWILSKKKLDESNRIPNKIWVDKGSEFYNRSLGSWLEKNGIKMYSAQSERKSFVAEGFIRILINKIYKYMISISKNVYINELDQIVNKYNNTYHSTIKMKPANVKSNTYIDSGKETNDENPKFEIGHNVRISKYKNVFPKVYILDRSEEVFVIRKVKNTVLLTHVINNLNWEEIVGTFYEKEMQKANQIGFKIGKVTKRKGDTLCIKWKGYNNSFNSWIDKKCIVWIGEYFPKPKYLGANVKVQLNLSNCVTKANLKHVTGADTSDVSKKTNLANLKSNLDELDIDKLKKRTKSFKHFKK